MTAPGGLEGLGAEFNCGCSIDVTPEWSIALWQCTAGDDCPAWQLITSSLEQCMRQLGIQALSGAIVPSAEPGRPL